MKRILTLDGGGVRGVFSLQILKRIEKLFRERNGAPDLVLSDVFDFFAGTSTGAIIATCLCWGMSVDEVLRLYVEQGPRLFAKAPWYQRFWNKYQSESLAEFFRSVFSEDGSHEPATMESRRLRCLLMVVMRNATTGSPWPLTNNPHAKYNAAMLPNCNLQIPIWQVLRASTAAPTYFSPERIVLNGRSFLFVDGALTPYNNPALIAVLQSTLPQYNINWTASPSELHVVSVGTGTARAKLPPKAAHSVTVFDQLLHAIPALIGATAAEQDLLCRILGDCLFGDEVDHELGDLTSPTLLKPTQQNFSYVRYDQRFDSPDVVTRFGEVSTQLDNLDLIPKLIDVGELYAEENVKNAHLDARRQD